MSIRQWLFATVFVLANAISVEGQCTGYCMTGETWMCEDVGSEACHLWDDNAMPVYDRGGDNHYYWSGNLTIGQGFCFWTHDYCGERLNAENRQIFEAAIRAGDAASLRRITAEHQGAWLEIDYAHSAIRMLARCEARGDNQVLADFALPQGQAGFFTALLQPALGFTMWTGLPL